MNPQSGVFERALKDHDLVREGVGRVKLLSVETFEILLSHFPGGPWLVYVAHMEHGRLMSLSVGWRALGWRREVLCSRAWIDFVHPDDAEPTRALVETSAATVVLPRGSEFRNRYICRSGEYQEIVWAGQVDLGDGQVLGFASMGARSADPVAEAHLTRLRGNDERAG